MLWVLKPEETETFFFQKNQNTQTGPRPPATAGTVVPHVVEGPPRDREAVTGVCVQDDCFTGSWSVIFGKIAKKGGRMEELLQKRLGGFDFRKKGGGAAAIPAAGRRRRRYRVYRGYVRCRRRRPCSWTPPPQNIYP